MNINFNLSEVPTSKIEVNHNSQKSQTPENVVETTKKINADQRDKQKFNEPKKTTNKHFYTKLLNKIGIDLQKKEISKKAIIISILGAFILGIASYNNGYNFQTVRLLSNLNGNLTCSFSEFSYQFPPQEQIYNCLVKEGVKEALAKTTANYPFKSISAISPAGVVEHIKTQVAMALTTVEIEHPARMYYNSRGNKNEPVLTVYDATLARLPTAQELYFLGDVLEQSKCI